jgi:hypothetical protein
MVEMGGEGSGNEGRRKFGNKFYTKQCGYPTKDRAENSARQLENIGVKTKVVKEIYWAPFPPHYDIDGYVVYYIQTYIRPSKAKRKYRSDGSIDGRPRF